MRIRVLLFILFEIFQKVVGRATTSLNYNNVFNICGHISVYFTMIFHRRVLMVFTRPNINYIIIFLKKKKKYLQCVLYYYKEFVCFFFLYLI